MTVGVDSSSARFGHTTLSRPIVCLITDRKRLSASSAGRAEGWEHGLLAQVRRAAAAGVDLIQIRERDLDARSLYDLVRRCRDAVGERSRLVVNDRVDVALAAEADGVHLRADSISPADVRRLVPAGFLVGRSVHAPEEVTPLEAAGVDYFIFGTVFPTESKPAGSPTAGLHTLEAAVKATRVPVLAVGGITVENAPAVAATGAAGIAAIGLFLSRPDDGEGGVAMRTREIRRLFDTSGSVV